MELTINIGPDLHRALTDYVAAYRDSYGTEELITELVPAILATFLDSDRAFARGRSG